MGKNNKLIERYKVMYQKINQITPEVYAALALALYRNHGWRYKRINNLFAESQEIWNECVARGIDMVKICEDETGICVMSTVTKEQ